EEIAAAAEKGTGLLAASAAPPPAAPKQEQHQHPSSPEVRTPPKPPDRFREEPKGNPPCSHKDPAPSRDSLPPEALQQAEALGCELMPDHPQPGNLPKFVQVFAKLLAASDDPAALIDQIRRSHAQWRRAWSVYAGGRFIPQLWRWIAE